MVSAATSPTRTRESTPTGATRPGGARRHQAEATRTHLLDVAERLYAEHGLSEVSNRQVAAAAGQANNSAVAYHVGTKADLVAAICERIAEPVFRLTREMVTACRGSDRPRDHVASVVAPYLAHLASLGQPSWAARFAAQVIADPVYGPDLLWLEALTEAHLEASAAMWSHAPTVAPAIVDLRLQMMRILVVHTCAEREAAAAVSGVPVDWAGLEGALVDAVTGLLTAEVG